MDDIIIYSGIGLCAALISLDLGHFDGCFLGWMD